MHRGFALVVVALVVLAGCSASPTGAPAPGDGGDGGDGGTAPAAGEGFSVRVVKVTDGDTMTVQFENGSQATVRLLGVDTPEVHAANTPDEYEGVPETQAGRDCLRRWGERASDFAKERLDGERVRLVLDEQSPARGYYGRVLAYLYQDGTAFNYRLLTTGHARLYDSTFTERDRYAAAEERARANGTGLWACADGAVTTTVEGASNGLVVARVHADAAGNDNENLNDEYVVLRNDGETTLDLGGYRVNDEADHRYEFPAGASIAPGATVTLYTGSGTDGDGDYYWGASGAVWNNGGDTVFVSAPNGTTVARRSYG